MKHQFSLLVCLIFVFAISVQPGFTADKIAPKISSVHSSSVTSISATITWSTNESSTTQVVYGLAVTYGSATTMNTAYVTSHSASMSGLLPNSTYHYRAKSKDKAGNLATSPDYYFTTSPAAPPLAFPGAVGFGASTPGGRGGVILKVTNLNDSGPGSLRDAVSASGKRTIIFETSGTINLTTQLSVRNPYITIAGQTAPSPGITLRGSELNINTHDVIVQHIRVRVGDIQPNNPDIGGTDTVSVDGPGSNKVIVDHVSMSWSIDENMSSWYDGVHDVTISNCIISEALWHSIHPEGAHSMGLLLTPNGDNVAIVGNLLAHNADRNPLISNGASAVIANNLFYNWMGGRATNIGNPSTTILPNSITEVSIIGNSYVAGPNTTSSTNAISDNTGLNVGSVIYYTDNRLENVANMFRHLATFSDVVSSPPISIPGFSPMSSSLVESSVLTNAGARPVDRDAVDIRVVNSVKNRNGAVIDSQTQVGGWPSLAVNYRTINVPSDANADDDNDGYTNFEEQVLFPMAAQVEGR